MHSYILAISKSFCEALEGDRKHPLRARLRYMLCVCDHHFSIAYRRPPVIAESLQLNSLAVRDVSLSAERKEFTDMAISAAPGILTFVPEEDDMRRVVVGTLLYVHPTIAFASVFLMDVARWWNRMMGLNFESNFVSHLLERMIVLLKGSVTSDHHLLYHIAFGLE
ncbi:hypothetical protein DL764_006589 [Monosporascus ibericus]|uniref:Transcription factor domain-containing protein n=1 Tax=Monosporascus ibericus TaxID=155417 RepID=A0A4Q4T4D9_9PEZI|nr:hypothetical protein DL764_006589 [Monosporascus ibericus]